MVNLVEFIHQESSMNDLLKAALIHFYIAYLHPWFDGNGRMARLIHLWYLVQQRYSSALFVPQMCIRDRYEEAKRIQPDDHRLQAGRDRPHPHKVSLPFRPEHRLSLIHI